MQFYIQNYANFMNTLCRLHETEMCFLLIFLFPSNAVFGRPIVVYGTGNQRGQVLGCTNIEPSLVAEDKIEISFLRNGTNPRDFDRYYI